MLSLAATSRKKLSSTGWVRGSPRRSRRAVRRWLAAHAAH
jgi:hypothetical protein